MTTASKGSGTRARARGIGGNHLATGNQDPGLLLQPENSEDPMDDEQEAERRRLRKLWREYNAAHEEAFAVWRDQGYPYPPPKLPLMPPELVGLTCGAKTRAGTPCKRKDIYENGRCPLHGGLSTGPTTPEGKAKAAENGSKPKRKKRTP